MSRMVKCPCCGQSVEHALPLTELVNLFTAPKQRIFAASLVGQAGQIVSLDFLTKTVSPKPGPNERAHLRHIKRLVQAKFWDAGWTIKVHRNQGYRLVLRRGVKL